MNILDKLHEIEEKKCIHDIHYCKGGIGLLFYYKEKDEGNWRRALEVDRYYPTFEEAIIAEYDKLEKEKQ